MWRRIFGPLVRNWHGIVEDVLGPVLSVPRHPIAMARFGLAAVPPATLARRVFETSEAQALFGGCAAHAFLPLERVLTSSFGTLLALSRACSRLAGRPGRIPSGARRAPAPT